MTLRARLALTVALCLSATPGVAADLQWTPEQTAWIAAQAPRIAVAGDLFTLRTDSFEVTTQISADFTVKTACYMHMVRDSLQRTLQVQRKIQVPVLPKVLISRDRAAMNAAVGRDISGRGLFKPIFYSSRHEIIEIP